jgi:hypothetical protein
MLALPRRPHGKGSGLDEGTGSAAATVGAPLALEIAAIALVAARVDLSMNLLRVSG